MGGGTTFVFDYMVIDINRWKEIVSKTLEFAIECGFKPLSISATCDVKTSKWKGIKPFLKTIENNLEKDKSYLSLEVDGHFRDYGLEYYSGYGLIIEFYFIESETKKNKCDMHISISSRDPRLYVAGEKPKNDINKLLRGLEKILGLKIVEYTTDVPDKIKINKHGFII